MSLMDHHRRMFADIERGDWSVMQTELVLHHWRLGQTVAERLCAGILRLSGYTDIEPQAPLGGPDGKKDVLVRREGKKYVAAVYFPPTPSVIAEITRKYENDLGGVVTNGAEGFVFLVNQHLTVGQRRDLLALGNPQTDEIFTVERMRAVLDDPRGYGLRLEFLRISMSSEEQVAYFSTAQQDQVRRAIEGDITSAENPSQLPVTARLDFAVLQMLHVALTHSVPQQHLGAALGGRLRTMEAFVVGAKGEVLRRGAPPHEILSALNTLLRSWQHKYADAVAADRERVLRALAWFHHGLVSVMPFADGNGRLARLVIDQAAQELCHRGIAADLVTDRPVYFAALNAADQGDLDPLIELLRAALI
ncbi:Fic family protein [Nocardia asteroides]